MKGAPSMIWTLGSVVAISRSRADSPGGRGATKVTEVISRNTAWEGRLVLLACGVCGCSSGSIVSSVAGWLHGGGVVEPGRYDSNS
jgi:hypothetical protein